MGKALVPKHTLIGAQLLGQRDPSIEMFILYVYYYIMAFQEPLVFLPFFSNVKTAYRGTGQRVGGVVRTLLE